MAGPLSSQHNRIFFAPNPFLRADDGRRIRTLL
ncbi:hypothetical protein BOTU111922_02705 [Bordetella tumulicola]